MNHVRALAVVCLLLVLAGGSVSFVLADSTRNAVDASKQTAVLTEQTTPVEMQILSEEKRVLRDQSLTFAVRVVSNAEDGLLLGLRIRPGASATFEFHNPAVKEVSVPLLYPDYDTVVYIPERKVDTEEYVPVTVSPETKFPVSDSTVEVVRLSRDVGDMLTAEFTFGIRCPIECRFELMLNWTLRNLELIVAVLGLLVAFFGRKKIWAVLRSPRRYATGTGSGEQRRDE